MNTTELKQALRNGLGENSTYFVSDGEAVCYRCVRKNFRDHLQTIKSESDKGFRVDCAEVNLENAKLFCAYCQESIDAVYRVRKGGEV